MDFISFIFGRLAFSALSVVFKKSLKNIAGQNSFENICSIMSDSIDEFILKSEEDGYIFQGGRLIFRESIKTNKKIECVVEIFYLDQEEKWQKQDAYNFIDKLYLDEKSLEYLQVKNSISFEIVHPGKPEVEKEAA